MGSPTTISFLPPTDKVRLGPPNFVCISTETLVVLSSSFLGEVVGGEVRGSGVCRLPRSVKNLRTSDRGRTGHGVYGYWGTRRHLRHNPWCAPPPGWDGSPHVSGPRLSGSARCAMGPTLGSYPSSCVTVGVRRTPDDDGSHRGKIQQSAKGTRSGLSSPVE